MPTIKVKFLGGMRLEMGTPATTLSLPDPSTVADLEARLREMGLDAGSDSIIIALNDRGLRQYPPDRPIEADDVVLVLPYIGGG